MSRARQANSSANTTSCALPLLYAAMANPTAATLLTKTDAVRTTCQSFFLFFISYSSANWNCNSTPKHANTKQLVHGTSGSATLVLVSIDVSAAMVKSTARRTPPTRPTAVSYCNLFNKIFNFLLVSCRDDWWETTTTVVRDSYDTRCPLFWPEGRWHTKRNDAPSSSYLNRMNNQMQLNIFAYYCI